MKKKKKTNLKYFLIPLVILILLIALVLIYISVNPIFEPTPECGEDFLQEYQESLITGDTSVCDSFREREYVNYKEFPMCILDSEEVFTPSDCINSIADSTQDIEVCKGYIFGKISKNEDNCLSHIDSLLQDPSLCELLTNQEDRTEVDHCYSFVATENVDEKQCDLINDLDIKSSCVREVVVLIQDLSICDGQLMPRVKYFCYAGLGDIGIYQDEEPSKLTQDARDKVTVELCQQIDEDDSLQDFCFMDVILYHNDSSLCGNEEIPQKRRVVEGCEYIGALET